MTFRYQRIPFHGHDPRKPLIARPYIPVYLHGNGEQTKSPYYALLDSGADKVLFPADLAREAGISDVNAGGSVESAIGIGGQRVTINYYNLMLQVLGDERKLPIEVGFSEHIFVPLLGRSFFIHFTHVVFSEGKEMVELKS